MVFTEDLWFLSGMTTVLLQKTWQVCDYDYAEKSDYNYDYAPIVIDYDYDCNRPQPCL